MCVFSLSKPGNLPPPIPTQKMVANLHLLDMERSLLPLVLDFFYTCLDKINKRHLTKNILIYINNAKKKKQYMCIYTVYKTKTYKNTFVLTPLLAGMYFNLLPQILWKTHHQARSTNQFRQRMKIQLPWSSVVRVAVLQIHQASSWKLVRNLNII